MTTDRKKIPGITSISNISYLLPEKWQLSSGIQVWGLNAGSQELVKIEFIFDAGTWFQSANLVAGLTNLFLNQGTRKYTAQKIAETFDFCGAYLQLSADQQFANVTILTLNKYIEKILDITADVIKYPVFPEKEITTQIAKKKQQFVVENNKVKTLAQKRFSQVLFGQFHPYANTNVLDDYGKLNREVFMNYHDKYYVPENCRIIVAGLYNDKLKDLLEMHFGEGFAQRKMQKKQLNHIVDSSKEKIHIIEKPGSLQSAIRIGRLFPNRTEPDFYGLNILTTILGGYFGSRLMANIREDKGYTYGIGSGVFSMLHAAYFSIMTEVGSKVCSDAIDQIFFEIERLQTNLVSDTELALVRNYLLGETLRSFDGIFAMSNSLKTLVELNLDYDHYDYFINTIRSITPAEIRELAVKYLQKSDLFVVVAGEKNELNV